VTTTNPDAQTVIPTETKAQTKIVTTAKAKTYHALT